MEQVVTQLQQEPLALRAQVTTQSELAEAVQAMNNLATAQFRKATPSLVDVKGLGCSSEFSSNDEDLQQWSKKTEAFFAGVIKESDMMLEWTAEQMTEISTETINREFLPIMTNEEQGAEDLECVLQQMQIALMALTIGEAKDIVANSRTNPLDAWPAEEIRSNNRRRKRNLSGTLLSSGTPCGN